MEHQSQNQKPTIKRNCYMRYPTPVPVNGDLRVIIRLPILYIHRYRVHASDFGTPKIPSCTKYASNKSPETPYGFTELGNGGGLQHSTCPTRIYSSGKPQACKYMELGPLPPCCTGSCVSVNVRFSSVRSSCPTSFCLSPPGLFSTHAF